MLTPDINSCLETSPTLFVIGEEDSALISSFSALVGVDFERDLAPCGSDYTSFEYHWIRESQRKKDYKYLETIYSPILVKIANVLNEIHEIEYDTRQWETAFGAWLGTALSVCFDRYHFVEAASKQVPGPLALATSGNKIRPAADTEEFMELQSSDGWNRLLLAAIGTFLRPESFHTVTLPGVSWAKKSESPRASRTIRRNANMSDLFFRLLHYVEKPVDMLWANRLEIPTLVTHRSYFSSKQEVFLRRALRKTVVFRRYQNPKVVQAEVNPVLRAQLRDLLEREKAPSGDKFFKFFLETIPDILPNSFMESFARITDANVEVNGTPVASLTANGHWYDDSYKLWLANSAFQGTQVILAEHGGSLRAADYLFGFEERSSNFFVSGWPARTSREVQLPLSSFVGRKPSRHLFQGKKLLIVTYPGAKWAARASSQPQSYRGLSTIRMCKELLDKLPIQAKRFVSIKVQSPKSSWERLEKEHMGLKELGYDFKSDSLVKNLGQSKLVICLYPQTTYFDALLAGRPTILLFDEAVSGVDQRARDLLVSMGSTKMFFTDANAAAHFVATIWDNPGKWWNSEPVRQNRSALAEYAMLGCEKPLDMWVTFLNEVCKEDKRVSK